MIAFFKRHWRAIFCGLVIGGAAVALTSLGNPANMGFCIACFLRDIAGALDLYQAGAVRYFRPEILGLVLGAMIAALLAREFKPRGGSSPFTRFLLGALVMMGALVFLGCPLRMVLRIGGGDLNAIVGLAGFIAGILIGILCLNRGFSLGRAYKQSWTEGLLFPLVLTGLFLLSVTTGLFRRSEIGPGAMAAPVAAALVLSLAAGLLAQRSRLCMVGGIRDAALFREFGLLYGFGAIVLAVLVGNALLGRLHFGFAGQPVAHSDGLWNALGMVLVGWGSVLLGGCPLRQLVLAGEGNSDSAITVLGMILGAAASHSFAIASSAEGTGANGPAAVVAGLVLLAVLSIANMKKEG